MVGLSAGACGQWVRKGCQRLRQPRVARRRLTASVMMLLVSGSVATDGLLSARWRRRDAIVSFRSVAVERPAAFARRPSHPPCATPSQLHTEQPWACCAALSASRQPS
jgi:hypothetical protein